MILTSARSLFLMLAISFQMSSAHAIWPIQSMGAEPSELGAKLSKYLSADRISTVLLGPKDYQMGSTWEKDFVTPEYYKKMPAHLQRAILATARYKIGAFGGHGTAFYLGQFGTEFIAASNHHVVENPDACRVGQVQFTKLGKLFKCKKLLVSLPEIDLSIFVLQVDTAQDASLLNRVAANFNFRSPLQQGQPLLTTGHGAAGNPRADMVSNSDADCIVLSKTNEFQLLVDPDQVNPAPYKAWSFANGCDISHGDSGSAMVDRATGIPVGIIWTAAMPKIPQVQTSEGLRQLMVESGDKMWKTASYAVPAIKMFEVLQKELSNPNLDPETKNSLIRVLTTAIRPGVRN